MNMERRKTKRFKKRLSISIDGKTALLNNISREGLQLSMNGLPGTRIVNILFQNGDQKFAVQGTVLWVKRSGFLYQPNLLGVTVVTSSLEYDQLVAQYQYMFT